MLDVGYCSHLHNLLHDVGSCCAKFKACQTFKPTTWLTFLLFHDRRSIVQHCWIRWQSSFNIVGAMHLHYTWSLKSYGLYPSHFALQVLTLLGVVASISGADPGFFLGGGALARLLLYFNTNKPNSFFFWQNTSCIRKPQVMSGGVRTPCTLLLDPPLHLHVA